MILIYGQRQIIFVLMIKSLQVFDAASADGDCQFENDISSVELIDVANIR